MNDDYVPFPKEEILLPKPERRIGNRAWEELGRRRREDELLHKVAIDRAEAALLKKGIEIKIEACGCCSSPTVTLIIDEKIILVDEEYSNMDNVRREPKDD